MNQYEQIQNENQKVKKNIFYVNSDNHGSLWCSINLPCLNAVSVAVDVCVCHHVCDYKVRF